MPGHLQLQHTVQVALPLKSFAMAKSETPPLLAFLSSVQWMNGVNTQLIVALFTSNRLILLSIFLMLKDELPSTQSAFSVKSSRGNVYSYLRLDGADAVNSNYVI